MATAMLRDARAVRASAGLAPALTMIRAAMAVRPTPQSSTGVSNRVGPRAIRFQASTEDAR